MPDNERLSVTLPADLARLIRAEVENGRFASQSAVVSEAMRVWQTRSESRTRRLSALRARIDEADGDPRLSLTDDEVGAHFEARSQAARTLSKDHA